VPGRTPSDRLVLPHGVVRLGVLFVVAVAGIAALAGLPSQVRDLGRLADANARLSFADRGVAAGNSILPEQQALYEIAGRIPPDASYRVSVGPPRSDWPDLTASAAEPFIHYWLLPRRPSDSARWIVCIGCDPADYPDATEQWAGEAGIRLLLERR